MVTSPKGLGPEIDEAYTKERLVLLSERVPQKNKTVTVRVINTWGLDTKTY
jgi:hypothetical protein